MKFLVMLSLVPPPACLLPSWSRTASIKRFSTTPRIPGYLEKTGILEESPAKDGEASAAIPAEEEESSSSGTTWVGVAEPEADPGSRVRE